MAVQACAIPNYAKVNKALANLSKMQALQDSNATDLWEKYRLLPPTPMYLVASRYSKDRVSWAFKTKWDLFKIFDKSFKKSKNLPQIRAAIENAIVDQSNIVSLRELYAVLNDDSKSSQEKVEAYYKVATTNVPLFIQIKQFIYKANVKKSDIGPAFADTLIQTSPDSEAHKEMIKGMIWKLKQGYGI